MQANKNFFILIVGSRASGKSELTKKFITEINEMKQVDEYFIFCNSHENYSKNYDNVYNDYDNNIIKNIIKKQIEDTKNNNSKHVLIILDDVIISNKRFTLFYNLFEKANNCNISCILSTNYFGGYFKNKNYNYVCFLRNNNSKNLIYDYVKDFINYPNFQYFNHIFDKLKKFDYLMIKT